MQKGSDGARGDDASMLKRNVVTWINDIWGLSKPPLSQRTKEGRGFSNEFTARLLCPSGWHWDDDEQVFLLHRATSSLTTFFSGSKEKYVMVMKTLL